MSCNFAFLLNINVANNQPRYLKVCRMKMCLINMVREIDLT